MSVSDTSLSERLSKYQRHIKTPAPAVAGVLTRVVGLTLEAKGLRAPVGSQCKIETMNGFVDAEIVGFNDQTLYLMPNDQPPTNYHQLAIPENYVPPFESSLNGH